MNRKNKIVTAVTFIAVVAVLVASYVMQSDDDRHLKASAFPDPIQDGDKDYPTAAEAEARYGEAMSSLKASLSDGSLDVDAMAEAIKEAKDGYGTYVDKLRWVKLDYYISPERMGSEYLAWSNLIWAMTDDINASIRDGLSGPCAETVDAALRSLGDDPDSFRNYGDMSEEAKALVERENALELEYYTIIGTEYTVTDSGGSTWTLEDIVESETLTYDEKVSLVAQIYEAMYGDAAEVYVELVGVRNDYAAEMGYGDYTEYVYKEYYGREYSPSEAERFVALAGKANDLWNSLTDITGYDPDKVEDELSWIGALDSEGLIKAVEPFIDSVDPDYARLLDYMVEYGLIYNCYEPGHLDGGFSIGIRTRNSAVIYNGYADSCTHASRILVHEFGHAANYCLVDGYSSNYDVSEIHSQGLEALYYASGLLGNGSEDAMAYILADNTLYQVFLAGIQTAFEVWAYETEAETGSLTADQALDKFGEILDSTGCLLTDSYDQKYYWVGTSHLFSRPHYYISYGTSALNAIELYLTAIEDYDEAREHYLDLTYQSGVYGYVPAVEKAGLTNALDIEESEKIIDRLEEALRAIGA